MEIRKVQVTLNGLFENSFSVVDRLVHRKQYFHFSIVQLKPATYYVSTDGNPPVAVKGELLVAPPMQTQTIRIAGDDKTYSAKYLFLNIDIDHGGSIDFYYDFPVLPPESVQKRICACIAQLSATSDPFEKNILCNQIAQALFSCAKEREKPFHLKLIQAIQYIRQHYTERLTVGDIARENQVSESSLYSLFRRYCRCTPITYLNRCRLDAAAHLLLSTDRTVAEIAAMVGFEDYSYFSKCFKRCFLASPSQYRRTRWA